MRNAHRLVAVAAAGRIAWGSAQPLTADGDALAERLLAYLTDYEPRLGEVVATERMTQRVGAPRPGSNR